MITPLAATTAVLSDGDDDTEKYYGQRIVSGINCIVTANNIAGQIKGQLSC